MNLEKDDFDFISDLPYLLCPQFPQHMIFNMSLPPPWCYDSLLRRPQTKSVQLWKHLQHCTNPPKINKKIIGKIIESQYIGIFLIISIIIDIDMRLPEIVSNLKELSILLSKVPGKLSKKYRYQKITYQYIVYS